MLKLLPHYLVIVLLNASKYFLYISRIKFVGYTLDNDRTTLAGLPQPIHEGVAILNKHMYKSLAEVQIEVGQTIDVTT